METGALPTGTVAFLFSDIEGSTRRWDAFGESMRDALRRHDEILRSEIEARRGYVFKTIGDAFCAAFWSASQALEAAIAVQRRLATEDFSAVDGLRVRMAISAGEADERGGDYFGTPVNRVARLLSSGHGGQILVSGYAADLIGSQPPDGVTLRHLGSIPLRDLKELERVYQPLAENLRSEFAPLRALETPPNNLPRQTTSFVGRARDVIAIETLLETEALITLVGAGGIGKTRLALEAATVALNNRKDGSWFVNFSSISDPYLVSSTVLSALGADQAKDVPPLDALIEAIGDRELLLVLDNCEHVVAEVARVVSAVLRASAHTTVIATSREALDVSGEFVYRLDSLDLASAVALFAERARAADRNFSLDAQRAVLEDICRRLDGIALAIELAAARVRAIPVAKLAEHLELRVLAGGRDRQPRQQTMRALIAWSYDLLNAQEQSMLRHSAVCIGGFTLSAIAQIFEGDATDELLVLETAASLVEKSLLVAVAADGQPRYRALEPIRQFARERLDDEGETAAALRRHALAYAATARAGYEEWDTNAGPDWLVRAERELPNFRAALEESSGAGDRDLNASLAGDTAPIFLRLSLLAEGIDWCESALRASFALEPAVEARLRYGLSALYQNRGFLDRSFSESQHAVELYRRGNDARGMVRGLSQLAHRYSQQKNYDDAQAAAEEALHLARGLADRRLLAEVLRRSAPAFTQLDADRLRAVYAESVTLSRSSGSDDETALTLMWWGQSEAELGNYAEAVRRFAEAREIAREELAAIIAGEAAASYLFLDDRANARPMVREYLAAIAKVRTPVDVAFALSYVARLSAGHDAAEGARMIAYAEKLLALMGWQRLPMDRQMVNALMSDLRERLEEAELEALFEEGAAWNEEQAVARATACLSTL